MVLPTHEDKAAFFDALFALDHPFSSDDSDENDDEEISFLLDLIRRNPKTTRSNRMETQPQVHVLHTPVLQQKSNAISRGHDRQRSKSQPERIVNAHNPLATVTTAEKSVVVKDTPLLVKSTTTTTTIPETIRRDNPPPRSTFSSSLTSPQTAGDTPTITDMARKRKRPPPPPKMAPLARRVFRGLNFFFLPNNDVSPARRMRIAKAIEYGATWVKTWTDEVSHIIVDRELCYQDVISFLKLESLPSNVVLVNELYPAECIQFLGLTPPTQSRYQVQGAPPPRPAESLIRNAAASPPPLPSSSENSLQLKPAKRDYAPPPETQSRSENSVEVLPLHELASPVSYVSSLCSPDKLRFQLLRRGT
ncbi:MAG: hypothetical protein M1817_001678 [Caeruleum heppii]|nr:MAG: hypothetical protein M1817_001678 [Caeruleum heppii]